MGRFWLFRVFDRSDTYRYTYRQLFLDEDVVEVLVDQSLSAPPGRERGGALCLLWSVDFVHHVGRARAERVASRLTEWTPETRTDEVWGFHRMLFRLRASHEDLHARVSEAVSPQLLGESLSRAGTRGSAGSWAGPTQARRARDRVCFQWDDGVRMIKGVVVNAKTMTKQKCSLALPEVGDRTLARCLREGPSEVTLTGVVSRHPAAAIPASGSPATARERGGRLPRPARPAHGRRRGSWMVRCRAR